MSPSGRSGWRRNLILSALLVALGISGFLVWHRRVAWHVVETLQGEPPSSGVPVPYFHDSEKATLTLADTREIIRLPPMYRGRLEVFQFPRSRAAFTFQTETDSDTHCWNVAAGREVPIPLSFVQNWTLSASGTRILGMQFPNEGPRRFQILGLDGSVLHERVLPELPAPLVPQREVFHRYTPDGNFLMITSQERRKVERIQILEMTSQATWSFDEEYADLTENGLLILSDSTRVTDQGFSRGLRAIQLPTRQEIWRTEVPEGLRGLHDLGHGTLAVLLYGPATLSAALFETASGRKRCLLEDWDKERVCSEIEGLDLRAGGPESFVVLESVWSATTGRKFPVQGAVYGIDFFEDGRRALVNVKCGWPGRVVDTESGKDLFHFIDPGVVVGPFVRLVGRQVFTFDPGGTVRVWERRYPEGWKGHLVRLEVMASVLLSAAILLVGFGRSRSE